MIERYLQTRRVKSRILQAIETVTLTERQEVKVVVVELKMLLSLKVTRGDRIRNEYIRTV